MFTIDRINTLNLKVGLPALPSGALSTVGVKTDIIGATVWDYTPTYTALDKIANRIGYPCWHIKKQGGVLTRLSTLEAYVYLHPLASNAKEDTEPPFFWLGQEAA